ncbi:DUF983 domain-containing protein [Pelagibacterium lacus]|uniref:DUF983 domain-containing protein n=1 Tax=Pelagibacterium lacus TaxID=2282655 RepID=A0A369W6Y8_9HYPH|nr:DUF983 domain-containing protein [Pelagibacterium lacus]RDE09807.1 DUF983 domain-containing protein [Pelagibacterium lacus]
MGFSDITQRPVRPLWPAMLNGMKCRCPACGEGKLFGKYLKVTDACAHCGTELHHQRADDAPPYIVITIVGHVAVAILVHLEMTHALHPAIYLATLVPLIILMSLWLLPVTKGAIVGMQWAQYMHGFDPSPIFDEIEHDERA